MKLFQKTTLLMTAILSFLFLTGCATDDIQVVPDDKWDNTSFSYYSSGDRELDPDPEEDCKCYMRVNSTENAAYLFLWGIIDDTSPTPPNPMMIDGTTNLYFPLGGGAPLSLPSDFRELNPPSNGWHSMIIYYDGTNEDLVINTEVRCYLQNGDGSETLATTTYHQFDCAEGTKQGSFIYLFEPRQFSCLVLTGGEVIK